MNVAIVVYLLRLQEDGCQFQHNGCTGQHRHWRGLQGFNPEVVDLISLKPFDMEQIAKSVAKTNRVVIDEECMKTGGIGASLSAVINESLFDYLDAPVKRLSSQDVPTAYAHELEAATIVQPEDVVEAVRNLCGDRAAVPA